MAVLFLAAVVPYLLPTAVAAYRDLPRKDVIFLTNLFLGWTIVGWIAAMIWACIGTPTVYDVASVGDKAGPGGLKLQGRDPRTDV